MPTLPPHVLARMEYAGSDRGKQEAAERERYAAQEDLARHAEFVKTWKDANYVVSSRMTLRGRRYFVTDGSGWRHSMEWTDQEKAEAQAFSLRQARSALLRIPR